MTISSSTRKAGPFAGDDLTTEFAFAFKVFSASDLYVVKAVAATGVETVLTLTTDYTVSLNADQNNNPGGTVTLPSVLASGYTLTLTSSVGYLQPTDLTNQGGFYPQVITTALDRATVQIQQLAEQVDRCPKVQISSSTNVDVLSAATLAVANDLGNVDTVAGSLGEIGTVSGNISKVNTVADNVADVTNFADVYLGAKAADPATRNDGSPLHAGDLYFSTTGNTLRAYTGVQWVPGTAGSVSVQRFSGTGAAVDFALSEAPASENNTQVYISGVYQQKDTYNVSGATLTFSVAPPVGVGNVEVVTLPTLALGETDSSLVSFLQAGAGATARSTQSKLRDLEVSVKDYGAMGDRSTDDTAAIQKAIDYVSSVGGGAVFFPRGAYKISNQLSVGYSDVRLIGEGKGDFHYTGASPVAATQLVWAGAATGTMVSFQPAGVQWISGCAFDGIYLNAGTGCQRGIGVYSSFGGRYIVAGSGFSTSLSLFWCSATLSETSDCMQNYVEVRGSTLRSSALMQVGGIPTANFCFNRIGHVDGNYQDGTAIQIYNADNNVFEHVRLHRQPGGSGCGIALNAGAFNEEARGNIFIDCSPGAGGVRAIGTEGGASASKENYILFYDTPNGAPLPDYGNGATLWYGTLDNKFPSVAAKTATGSYNSTSLIDVSWDEKVFDLMNSFTSPTFTAPKPGKYRVKWKLSHAASVTANDKWVVYLTTPTEQIGLIYYVGSTIENTIGDETTVDLKTGDTVKLRIQRAAGTGTFPVLSDSRFNRFEINYVSQGL